MKKVFALPLLLLACKSEPKSAPVIDASAATPTPPHDAGAPDAALRPADREDANAYAKALDEGRRATRAKKYDDAKVAFDRALAARRDDPRALAERGYAELLANDLDRAQADIDRALAIGTLDRSLEAAVQFNRGLVLEKRGNLDEAHAAFVLADTLEPTAARKVKLNGKTGCAADMHPQTSGDAADYADFKALADDISPKDDLGDPRKSVCVGAHFGDGAPVCSGRGPWTVFHNYLLYTEDEWIVWPHEKKLFAIHVGRVGGWPAHCTMVPVTEASLDRGLIHLKTESDGKGAALDENGKADGDQLPCIDTQGYLQEEWMDPYTGKLLLAMRSFDKMPKPTIAVTDTSIEVKGAGCDRTIPR